MIGIRSSGVGDQFRFQSYAVIRSFLSVADAAILDRYVQAAAKRGFLNDGDSQVPETPCLYGDPIFDDVLEDFRPKVEEVSGIGLYPSYSYLRRYKTGDKLAPHIDRPACEISLTVTLALRPQVPWPIWVESHGNPMEISLDVGDALLYRGTEVSHWRELFSGEQVVQVFLHYVDREGPNREWKFDKRPSLGTPPVA